jgi:hypothetical protein
MPGTDIANIDKGNGALYSGAGLDATLIPSASYAVGTVLSNTSIAGANNPTGNLFTVGSGIVVVVDVTNVGGAGTVTVFIEGYDATSGKYYTLLATTALAAVATTVLTIAPAAPVTANVSTNMITPRQVRARAVVAGNAVTFSVGASVIAA